MIDNPYKRPPVTEAVIGINFTNSLHPDVLKSANSKFNLSYPNFDTVTNLSLAVNLPENPNKLVNDTNINLSNVEGYRFSSLDMTELLLIWPSMFLVTQLAPYKGWDILFDRFTKNWSTWKRVIDFKEINRIGVRFINRIDIPVTGEVVHHENYLNIFPNVPSTWPPLLHYGMQSSMPIEKTNFVALINTAIVDSPILNHMSIVIDIDVSTSVNVPQSDTNIFNALSEMRTYKNRLFEDCITDKSRELFNK